MSAAVENTGLNGTSVNLAEIYGKAALVQTKSTGLQLKRNAQLQNIQSVQTKDMSIQMKEMGKVAEILSDIQPILIVAMVVAAVMTGGASAGLFTAAEAAIQTVVSTVEAVVNAITQATIATVSTVDATLQLKEGQTKSNVTLFQGANKTSGNEIKNTDSALMATQSSRKQLAQEIATSIRDLKETLTPYTKRVRG